MKIDYQMKQILLKTSIICISRARNFNTVNILLFLRYKRFVPGSFSNCKQIISPSELRSLVACS